MYTYIQALYSTYNIPRRYMLYDLGIPMIQPNLDPSTQRTEQC